VSSIRRIDSFLEEWPDAEFGPGHIVLSDGNIGDSNLDWCLAILDAVLDGKPWPDATGRLRNCYVDDDPEEMLATREFLRALRAVSEEERVAPEEEV
jgi:hypothetical protein